MGNKSLIDEILIDDDDKKFQNYVNRFKEKHIPSNFNQIDLMNELTNEEIDHYVSISNRTDGKSFNYIHFAMNLAFDYDVKFMLLCRNYTVRDSYQDLIRRIADKSKIFDSENILFIRSQFYIQVIYKEKVIGIITDLNQATNLKYASNYIVEFPFMIYDEFLAIEGDYLPDEWTRLKTIYSSVNRDDVIPLIKFPKMLYLGNAVNFNSPVLSELQLFNILENHPLNGGVKIYQNIALEMNRNDKANERRNLRAFNEKRDAMTVGEFETNKYNLASESDRANVMNYRKTILVKLDSSYLQIDYNIKTNVIILSILGYSDSYDYNINLSDNKENTIFLKESYFDENYIKKHNRGFFLYDNNYSKNFITDNFNLTSLKIMKLIRERELKDKQKSETEISEAQFKDNYIERSKHSIMRRYFG